METTTEIAPESTVQPKMHFTGKVIKTTLAGAIIDIGQDIPGVVHISQLQSEPVNRVEDVVQVGQSVDVWVRRARKDRIELTMIEPLPLEWREIKPEMVVKGKVTRLESYGAFVDIGAERPGMIHVSEMAHGYVRNAGEKFHEGEEVEAIVLEVNRRKKQIRLSMKALQPKPEESAAPAKGEAKKNRGKRRKGKRGDKEQAITTEPIEIEPTTMELAWREALERAERKQEQKVKQAKVTSSFEQEDILSRSLEHRLPTG